jgi:nucleotide-binding universal stress UspA family protein
MARAVLFGPFMKTILVALDGSRRAAGVLSTGVSVARAHGGRIVILRAVGLPPDLPQDLFKVTDLPLAEVLRRQAETYLEGRLLDVPPELRAAKGVEVHVGVPWEAICTTARERRADLVIIGSHGYGGLDRLLGTTAAKVVNHAPCSVLVVRDSATEGSEERSRV